MAKKSYNVPAQITEEDRQKGRDEMARSKRERTSDSDISSEDKDALKKLLEMEKGESEREGEEPKGGMVNKSKRGDGCVVKGHTRGKMY